MGIIDKIREKPKAAALALAALTVLVIILASTTIAYHSKWKKQSKNTFLTPGIGNFEIAGHNPMWWFGSGDAGNWGSMARATTPQQASIYTPSLRRSVQKKMLQKKRRAAHEAAVHAEMMMVGSTALSEPPSVCDAQSAWDPPAIAEAEGLGVLGSLPHAPWAEKDLQRSMRASDL